MLEKGLVDRINYLARKQRDGGLTEEEKREQHELRQKYLAHIRSQVVEALESAGFRPKNRKHGDACGCETCASEHRHDKNYLN
ncbi:MAG: hypothetical protein A4E53_03746 [Pelotomaculum sp. PtaB.Bin104]|nr:MAG: hypothetical protein A4E53_03746 [Pelotomaculum sp. PtaB.Bin104]